MTDQAKSSTLHMKKPKAAVTEGKQRHAPKNASPEPNRAPPKPQPKKEKEFKVQYRAKPENANNPFCAKFTEWTDLAPHYKVEHAANTIRTKMNGNALDKLFDYRVVNKEGQEVAWQS